LDDRYLAGFKASKKDLRHQEAGYDEEDVDAGEAARDPEKAEMESDDQTYGNGPKSVDIVPKGPDVVGRYDRVHRAPADVAATR
jgi:hypothetical protein